jgi:hypothetical protein
MKGLPVKNYTKEADWKILEICPVEVQKLKQTVEKFYNEWLLDTSRQKTYVVHENTFMYELLWFNYAWRPGQEVVVVEKNTLYDGARNELEQIYSKLEEYVDGTVVHSEIVSMNPKSRIRVHKDRGDMLYLARRFHVPLKTNKQAFFTVEDENFHLSEGKLYELNNIKYHGVRNDSDESRIHLIIDLLPQEYVNGAANG